MMTIEYDPDKGYAIGDGDVEMMVGDIIKDLANGYLNPISIANESVFHALQLAILEGRISHRELQFRFRGKDLPLDVWGRPTIAYPDGFCDFQANTNEAILRTMMRHPEVP